MFFWDNSSDNTEKPSEITQEEAAKAISQEADDDDFKDAVEEEEEEIDGFFPVSEEELSIIRAELACEFPDDYTYLSDAYILSVASKPYSKDPSIRRPLEVSPPCLSFDELKFTCAKSL